MAGVGPDALTLRAIVTDITPDALAQLPGVRVTKKRPEAIEIETPRYRAFADLAKQLAEQGANFVEIAGNDDILSTPITDGAAITAIGPYSVSLRGGPGLVAQLYAPGAHLVLPAGLTGCLPQNPF